jgi:hypothetical protein
MRSVVIDSGAPYVFVVSIADAGDVAIGAGDHPVDVNFPSLQPLVPSATNTLATGGVENGAVAYNPTGPAASVVFMSALGYGGAAAAPATGIVSAKLKLNANGTPVLDGTTHTPIVTVALAASGAIVAGQIMWVALVPASYG